MNLNDFNYELPAELIARYPLSKRSASRLLSIDKTTGMLAHLQFTDVLQLIEPGDLLIFNDTKVIPARVYGNKVTGGEVELLVERILDDNRMLAQARASKPLKTGDFIFLTSGERLRVSDRRQQFYELSYEGNDHTILELIENIGEIPLPPYLHREPEQEDFDRYQTVYAKYKGSVAAPTAGLHFDHALLDQLDKKQVVMDYLTLHIGAGTFTPIRVEDIRQHQMHAEYLEVSESLCRNIEMTKSRGNRVIAVGTTSLRALETASQSGNILPYQGETNIFIYPGYRFQCVDALITNLHLPRSTLLMLVCAFGGHDFVMHAYRQAVLNSYRFYSYGDAMWMERKV